MYDRGSTHHTPRWVKAIGIMAIALLLLLVGLHLIGMSLLSQLSDGHGEHAPPPSAAEHAG
jgi:hypothetical protein